MDFEDVLKYNIDGLWMFEADAFIDGPHVEKSGLQKKGFSDGVEARKKLLSVAKDTGLPALLKKMRINGAPQLEML